MARCRDLSSGFATVTVTVSSWVESNDSTLSRARRTRIGDPPSAWACRPLSCGDPELARGAGDVVTGGDVELLQHRRNMVLDGLGREEQATRDLPVRQPFDQQLEDLQLAGGQPCRVRARGRSRPA